MFPPIAFAAVLGVIVVLAWRDEPDEAASHFTAGDCPPMGQIPVQRLVPWYIVGFLVLMGLRSVDLVPHTTLAPMAIVANLLTVISIGPLGLGTESSDRRAGPVAASRLRCPYWCRAGQCRSDQAVRCRLTVWVRTITTAGGFSCACDISHMTGPAFRATPPATISPLSCGNRGGFNVPACQIACDGLFRGNAHARTEYGVGIGNFDDQPCRHLVDGKWPWRRRDRAMRRRALRSDRRH